MEIILAACDGVEVATDRSVAQCSKLLCAMMDDDMDTDGEELTIPLGNVNGDTLKDIVAFCEHYVSEPFDSIPKPLVVTDMTQVIPEWYCRFLDVPQPRLFEYLTAADYMEIPALLELICASIAADIKDKTPEQIRRQYADRESA
jgi:S-phase kinase-associated protein 1